MTHIDAQQINQSAQEESEIDIKEILGVLWRRKWMIAGLAVVGILIGGYYGYRIAVPKYSSSVSLAWQVRNESLVDLKSVVSGISTDSAAINTELQVIRSSGLLEKLVTELDLTKEPEFNPTLKDEPRFSVAKLKAFVRSFLVEDVPMPGADTGPSDEAILNATIGKVRGVISSRQQRGTYIFHIGATSEDPHMSALIANTLANLYIRDQIEVKFQATEDAISWLSERVITLEAELKEKENAVKDLRSRTDLTTQEALLALGQQAKDIRDRLADGQADAALQGVRLADLKAQRDAGQYSDLVEHFNDPTLNRIFRQMRPGDDNSLSLLNNRLQFLLTREETNLARTQQQVAALETSSKRLEERITVQTAGFSELQQLQRDVEATRTLHETFLTRLKETTVQRGLQQADSRILSNATRGHYVEPQKTRIMLICGFLGALIGLAIAMIRHFLHNGFRTSEQVETTTGHIVLGQIPKMPIKGRQELIGYLNDKPTSAAAEAIRNLRTSVLLSNVDVTPQVIMSTSSIPGEGKTTLAMALAHNFFGLGKRVLLIDGDTRRRTLGNYIQGDSKTTIGLATAMTADEPLENFLVQEERLGFDILLGEKTAVNAADLFSSERFKTFLQELREIYDYIIIDSPPVLVVPDARIVGQLVDAVVFSVAWDRTAKQQVTEALRSFDTVGVKVTGIALSQIDPKGMKRYGYGGKYGAYAGYGGRYYTN